MIDNENKLYSKIVNIRNRRGRERNRGITITNRTKKEHTAHSMTTQNPIYTNELIEDNGYNVVLDKKRMKLLNCICW